MPVHCIKCGTEFRDNFLLQRHYERKNPCDKKTINQCTICSKTFKTIQGLTYHNNKKTPCKPNVNNISTNMNNPNLNHSNMAINGNIYNIHINAGDRYYKTYVMNQNETELKIHSSNLVKLILLSNGSINKLYNISDFTDLITRICFDIERPENWRFILQIRMLKEINNEYDFHVTFKYLQVLNSDGS